MELGYRGMSFKKRAQSMSFNDWNSARDFLVQVGDALDRLESELYCSDSNDQPLDKPAPVELSINEQIPKV